MREFKEELLGILSIDIDNFIDTYPHIVFENNYQKYIQFRFLAKINPYKTENIEELFAKKYTKEHKRPEHDACYKASYTQALDYMRI
jgi:hypothetical protein